MRILDWECTINHDGTVRGAQHAEHGVMMWTHQGLMGNAAVPPEVLEWLMRPVLRATWNSGWDAGYDAGKGLADSANPYNGEPPNKDNEPS